MQEFTRCAVCDRMPLVGEGMTVLSRGRREAPVCGLCLAKPRAQALGEPVREGRVRSAAGAETVRRITPAPVAAPQKLKSGERAAGRSATLAG
jgi:hypothetical protein